mmetsp:Transcript_11198/g.38873  ORF Transcript_11198/g.38873 Transcript_11198/m.38873 type:complete len:212 (-) Transcript_11198:206-841(-)
MERPRQLCCDRVHGVDAHPQGAGGHGPHRLFHHSSHRVGQPGHVRGAGHAQHGAVQGADFGLGLRQVPRCLDDEHGRQRVFDGPNHRRPDQSRFRRRQRLHVGPSLRAARRGPDRGAAVRVFGEQGRGQALASLLRPGLDGPADGPEPEHYFRFGAAVAARAGTGVYGRLSANGVGGLLPVPRRHGNLQDALEPRRLRRLRCRARQAAQDL